MRTDLVNLEEYLEKKFGSLTFGEFLRSIRDLQEISQVTMAKHLGISKGMLCDIEKGRQLVSAELAAKFAKKCKIPAQVPIQLALQDQLRKAKLKYTVQVA